MTISNLTLMKIAAIGGFATAAMGYALRSKLNDQIAQTEYYQEAINTIKAHRGVIYLLGEPIKVGKVDVSDNENNYTHHLSAHYQVPIRGPKEKALLYFWASRRSENDRWNVHRIELQLKNEPNKRLLVKNEDLPQESSITKPSDC